MICITVKGIGEFSHRLCNLCPGDTIEASLPYGYFYCESESNPLVLISGGIGVAPFRSMILSAIEKYPVRSLYLLASYRDMNDILFKDTFAATAQTHPNVKVYYFITRDTLVTKEKKLLYSPKNTMDPHFIFERMTSTTLSPIINEIPTRMLAEYFLCGSISFTRDIWRILKSLGISEERISTEAFFSH
jgi:ferredoxin-NADP reductase